MNQNMITILTVDDDPKVCFAIEQGLNGDQYRVVSAYDGDSALQALHEAQPTVVLLDLKMPGLSGFELLSRIKQQRPDISVLILTGHSETENVVQAMRHGADDFISKPFDIDILKHALKNLLEKKELKEQVSRLENELRKDSAQDLFIGESPLIRKVWEQITQIAASDLTVLIRGESGTGKDVCARLIHAYSPRAQHPFIKINCAALPESLLESELFGHEKGSFTGANKTKPGRFEQARNGSVFLDEIGEMPIALQPKLLQAIEYKEFVRVGGSKTITVDVRFIAATNQNLERQIAERQFREDLFFRLNEFVIFLAPLRQRKEDIPLLVDHFIRKYSEKYKQKPQGLSPASMQLLLDYDWPGNVRELESLIKRVLVMNSESLIETTLRSGLERQQALGGIKTATSPLPSAAPSSSASPSTPSEDSQRSEAKEDETSGIRPLKVTVADVIDKTERAAIREALEKTRWNRKRAARLLKISYSSLLRRIEKYKLEET